MKKTILILAITIVLTGCLPQKKIEPINNLNNNNNPPPAPQQTPEPKGDLLDVLKGKKLDLEFKTEKDYFTVDDIENLYNTKGWDFMNEWKNALILEKKWLTDDQLIVYVYSEAGSGSLSPLSGEAYLKGNDLNLIIENTRCSGNCPLLLRQEVVSFKISNLERKDYNYNVSIESH
jgi:hypothetical protein